MKNIYYFLVSVIFLSGCAAKMLYLNTQKSSEEIREDKDACDSQINASDFKDPDLKQKKFNDCMKDKGYNVVSEEKAEKIQGFKELWIKPGADFKAYEVVFIDKVDASQAKTKNKQQVAEQDIDNLGKEMLRRFSEALSAVMPVVQDREKAVGKKALCISLELNDIAQTKAGLNAALKAAGRMSGLPLPDSPQGAFSFAGTISDFSAKETLISFADKTKSGKNTSLLGLEKFEQWKQAYNVMDYWADHLAALLAKERGQEYKSRLGIKLIDF